MQETSASVKILEISNGISPLNKDGSYRTETTSSPLQQSLGTPIPFAVDEARTPVAVIDPKTKKPMTDEESGLVIMSGGDPLPTKPLHTSW